MRSLGPVHPGWLEDVSRWRALDRPSMEYLARAQREFLQAKGRGDRERWRAVLLTWWRVGRGEING